MSKALKFNQVFGVEKKVRHPSGSIGYIITMSDGTQWSVLNMKDHLRNMPLRFRRGLYQGWEALNGNSVILRDHTFKEIMQQILDYKPEK